MRRVIIAGSRTLSKLGYVEIAVTQALSSWLQKDQDNWRYYYGPFEVVSGGARGIDFQAELYAKKHTLKYTEFPANWDELGKGAGFIRNEEMAEYANALIAIWDGTSKGTYHMIGEMVKRDKPVYVYCP